jgi:hypothetical protein
VNARELFEALGRLPGARRLPVAADGIVESVEARGVELARTEAAEERGLRAAWRERQGGGQMALLLVADDADAAGCVRALGPIRRDGPVRVVGANDLLRVLERLPSEGVQRVRRLEKELRRLDRTSGAPRMGQPGYFPDHVEEQRADFRRTTPAQRVMEGIELSRFGTRVAVAGSDA